MLPSHNGLIAEHEPHSTKEVWAMMLFSQTRHGPFSMITKQGHKDVLTQAGIFKQITPQHRTTPQVRLNSEDQSDCKLLQQSLCSVTKASNLHVDLDLHSHC